MTFLLLNIDVNDNSIIENQLDNDGLKTLAFSAKIKNKLNKKISYMNVLCPIQMAPADVLLQNQFLVIKKYTGLDIVDVNELYSIWYILNGILKYNNLGLSITKLGILEDKDLAVLYSDGSSSAKLNSASYGCCRLLIEDAQNGIEDELTGLKFAYDTFSDVIADGTNNIGELNGVRCAINNHITTKDIHVIISDSNYSIKTFREYIYNWKNNGYKTYSKKEIANKDLIIDTFNDLTTENQKGYIFLFKWTRGHVGTSFNEICDKLAKEKLNIGGTTEDGKH